ncbi:nucleotidyltransferase domain-containing protein [Oscillibacter valericigenes]|nr:nucleotidyltransferase domain-containing protein [Oscillibacter valericigenes]
MAEKYQLKAVYLFGSYARNNARDNSDIHRGVCKGSAGGGKFQHGYPDF